ncbi:hypothetical protein, partial [Prevotella sp. OH937_COT-195]|uniref:hypothetical protein n=1 Tax=Prevotella sp. OH937_COT-195 TaxID=2491051 RepID=UPI0013156C86
LTLNWAANLLGTWKQTVKNDVMQAVSEKTVTYNDADGNMHTEKLETLIAQNANGVSISAKVNDLERAGIHLNGKDSRIDLLAEHTRFLAPTGLPFIKIGMDEQGVPYLVFMMPDGVTPAYNLGYTGLTQIINDSVKAGFGTPLRLRYLGILEDLEEGISAEKLFKACDPYGMAAYFRFTQSRVRQADGTLQLVPGGVDVDGKYYDSNAMSANSLPTGRTLNECCGSSVITQQVYTLWISEYTSQQGWQNSPGLNPPTWITRKFLIYYVKDSRIVKNTSLSVEFSVINGKNVYSVQPWQGTDPGIYVPADV